MESEKAVDAAISGIEVFVGFFSSPFVVVVLICVIFGSFGGLVAVWVGREKSERQKTLTPLSSFENAAIGSAGAFGFLFFTLAVGGITENVVGSFSEQLRLLSICVIAGFGARRLLPQMAGHLEEQVAKANKDASEAKEKAEDASDLVHDLKTQLDEANRQVETLRVRTQLKHAIETPDADRIWKTALADAKEIIRRRASNISSLWIDAARIEMRYVSIEAALQTLSDMVALMDDGMLAKNINYPTAFFNRACYLAQLYQQSGDNVYGTQALESLRKVFEVADSPHTFAQYVENDAQLKPIHTIDGFQVTLEMFKNAKPDK